ncbi:MAG TPA: type 4b pilus protein PilO2, partial [Alphaproteobacteria bacterium]
MADNEEKDFMDFELDDPLAAVEPLAAPVREKERPEVVGNGVLIYEGKKYAVGLSWLVAEESGNSQLALKRAKGFGADFYCMRANVVAQHGFGYLSLGHRINMPALASVLADVFVGEWHGVFAGDNGWWYVAVHADNIAPKGDLFFASEEEAYNFFVQESKSYRWPRAYAPTGWNLSDATSEIPLNKVIGEATPPTLKPVTTDAIFSGRRNRNLAIVGAIVLVLLLIAGVLGQQFLPALIPQRASLPVPDLAVGDDLQAPPEEPILIAEREADNLSKIPLMPADQFVEMCLESMSSISKAVPGWTLSTLRCRDTFVEGTWTQQIGTMEMA